MVRWQQPRVDLMKPRLAADGIRDDDSRHSLGRFLMSVGALTVLIGIGAVAVAVWVDARFRQLAPGDMRTILAHLVLSGGSAQFLVPAALRTVADAAAAPTLLVVFGVAFPALVYLFLVWIWLIRMLHRAMTSAFR